jgi:hypothetical protein
MCGFEEFYQGKGLAPSGDRGLRVEIFSNPGKVADSGQPYRNGLSRV